MIKAVNNVDDMLKNVDVTKGAIEAFQFFAESELFKDIPKEISCELIGFSTTLSYLNMKYFFKKGDLELSFILKGSKNFSNDGIFTDYLACSYAMLKNDKIISDVHVFEGITEDFKKIFDNLIKKTFKI